MMTLWEDIVGYTCISCGKWATHWYDNAPLCCSCHLDSPDTFMEKVAITVNTQFQKGQTLDVEVL